MNCACLESLGSTLTFKMFFSAYCLGIICQAAIVASKNSETNEFGLLCFIHQALFGDFGGEYQVQRHDIFL